MSKDSRLPLSIAFIFLLFVGILVVSSEIYGKPCRTVLQVDAGIIPDGGINCVHVVIKPGECVVFEGQK
jgi:hypothetical protein